MHRGEINVFYSFLIYPFPKSQNPCMKSTRCLVCYFSGGTAKVSVLQLADVTTVANGE